jgi:TolA-binding protein
MGTKIKITKQQIKEDKFTTFMFKTREWIEENWQVLSIVAAVVIIVIIGSVYYVNMQSKNRIDAADRMSKAVSELRQRNYQVAIVELNSIIDDYGGKIAGQAVFNLGNAYYESQNYDEAIRNYQLYIDKYKGDPIITSSAMAGIAACYENQQEFEKAGEQFLKAAQYNYQSPGAPGYLQGAVRNFVNAGDKDRTEEVLDILREEFPNSEQLTEATILAARLRAK